VKLNRDIMKKLPFALRVEIEENAQRKALTQSELATQQRRLLDELRKHKAPGTRTDLKERKPTSGKALPQVHATGIIGRLFNESRTQVEKRLAVVAAAKAEPRKYGKLVADMDRTGRVNGVYTRLKVAKQAELIRAEPPPLPGNGPYRVIVADPPWPTRVRRDDSSCRRIPPYPGMSIEQICEIDVASITSRDCILWLWTTNYDIRQAFKVLDTWGFEHRIILTWVKNKMGTGEWLRGQTEHCLMATRGKPIVTLTNQTTVLHGGARGHSVKPVEFYDFVEKLCPAPRYADLFSRYRHNGKWDTHGDESPDHVERNEQ
jgi:N6-adenosine-specific RNA methylase IME4